MPSKIAFANHSLAYRQVEISLKDPKAISQDDLHILDNFGISEVIVSFAIYPMDIFEPTYFFSACRDNNISNELYPDLFDVSQLQENNIIVPMRDDHEECIVLFDHEYNIVKKLSNTDDYTYYLPIHAFIENNIEANTLSYILKDIPTLSESNAIRTILNNYFGKIDIRDYQTYATADDERSISVAIMIVFAGAMSILSYIFLFNFLIDENKEYYISYIIVGGTYHQIITSMFGEILIMCISSLIGASLIHYALYNSIFVMINTTIGITYNIGDYIACFAMSTLLSFLVALPYSIKMTNSTTIKLKREVFG